MVLVMVNWGARPRERQPETLTGELENNSSKPRDLVENWHRDGLKKVQLTLSKGKKKKEDEVGDEDDDDAVRTSVSQDRVTATLCTEKWFLSTHYR
jgi:hypothetical protein